MTTTTTSEGTPMTSDIQTTTVDLVLRLQVKGSPAEIARHRDALECLAAVMAVQAEDGLWSLGQPEAENDDGPSEYITDIETTNVLAILIGERSRTTLQARCVRLEEIAHELATIASHAVHVPGKTTAMDDRIGALVRELDLTPEEIP